LIPLQSNISVGYGLANSKGSSFRAGAEAARDAVANTTRHPISAVLVFASVSHELSELLAGIRSITGDAPLIGVSTAGEICNGVHEKSALVVVLASEFLKIHIGTGQHASSGWQRAVDEALETPALATFFNSTDKTVWNEMARSGNSAFAMVFAPGNTRETPTYGYEIVQELRRRCSGEMPLFGGCAADDWTMNGNFVLCNEQVYADGLLVAVFETGLQFGIAMAHGFRPGQQSATVTRADDHEVQELDGRPAADVYAEMVGISRESLAGKHLTLTVGQPMGVLDAYGQPQINVASYFTPQSGICFARPVSEGTRLTLMEAVPDEMIAAGKKALLKAMLRAGTESPAVAFVCSCALRSRMLKHRSPEEISGMGQAIPNIPVLGFYGFGEEGVTDDGTSDHNHGIVSVLVFGNELTCNARISRKYAGMQQTLEECTTERSHIHTVLRDSNQHFMALFDGAHDAIFVSDHQSGIILDANASAERLMGCPKYKLVGRPLNSVLVVQAEDAGVDRGNVDADEIAVSRKGVVVAADRHRIPVEVNASIVEYSNGIRVLQTISRDISQRNRANAELRRLNRALSALGRCNEALVHATDQAQLLNRICEIVVQVGGYRMAWVGFAEKDSDKTVRCMAKSGLNDGYIEKAQITWNDAERGCGPVGTAIKTGEVSIFRNMLQSSNFSPWRDDAVLRGYAASLSLPLRDEARVIGALSIYASEPDAFDDREVELLKELASNLAYGITALQSEAERKQAEAELLWKTAFLEAVGNATVDGILVVDRKRKKIFRNEQFLRLWKIPEQIADDQSDAAQVQYVLSLTKHPEKFLESVQYLYDHPDLSSRDEIELRDGTVLDRYSAPVLGKDGQHFGRIWAFRDITDRKQAEQALRSSEERFRQFAENTREVFWVIPLRADEETYVSPAYEQIWNRSCESVRQNPTSWMDGIHPDDLEESRIRVAAQLAGENTDAEYRIRTPDGQEKWIRDRAFPIRDQSGQLIRVVGVSEDITEQKRHETELASTNRALSQAQKMEAVGRLAGGIAHDFNNLLMVIQSYTEMLQDDLSAYDPLRKNTREIMKAAERAASLTGQMLAFSRKQVISPVVLDVNAVIHETAKMLQRVIGEDIEFRIVPEKLLWPVEADPDQIAQVVMNLCVNSRDAMPQGGNLTIATSNVTVNEQDFVRQPHVAPGEYVNLSVTDTGSGISKELQERIFEPFFTTKEVGKGTGLGLSMVYGIVEQSGGRVWVDSEPGCGACFTIYLPKAKKQLASETSTDVVALPRGKETLLVVEDEKALREAMCDYLSSMGYTVLSAASGREALTLASQQQHIDLLVTDVVMPKMSGRELSQVLGSLRPELKTIHMSGYTDDAVLRHGIHELGATFLQKPFSLGTLARKVRESLDRTESLQ